jgi:RNA polymerase sigma-70 factor (ECF subfamily)
LLAAARFDNLSRMSEAATRPPGKVPSEPDEAALVAAIKNQDEAAFETVVRAYGPRMLAVAVRFLQNEHDAQDAVQDAFLSAFRSIDGFQGGARLSTWLHRIVVNAALMKIRGRRRRPERAIEDLLPRFHADGHRQDVGPAWNVSPEAAASDRETREAVRRGIDELPDSYRTVLLLRDIEGRNTQETAELLEVTEGVVKTRLHRARQALRTLLAPRLGGAAP